MAWLQTQQAADGGFVGFSGTSDPGATLDAVIALAAAEHTGVDSGDTIAKAIAYLGSGDVALVYAQTGVGQASKLVLGLVAAGADPADFAHVDPLQIILNGANVETGIYGTGIFDHALAVLALIATGNDVPETAFEAFAATQSESGGWAFDASTDPAMADSNTTAIAIQALSAAGQGDGELVANGVAYLESIWLNGGAAYNDAPDALPDANSTSLVIQALVSTGAEVTSQLDALTSFQNASGAFHYNADDTSDNLFASLQAIPALALAPFPVEAVDGEETPVASPADSATPVTYDELLAA